jgi:hypothetical protein
MPTLSIEKSQNLESAKGSAKSSAPRRRKATSAMVIAKNPPRSVVSKSERAAAAKMPDKAGEPRLERVTKQERMLTLLSQPEGASIQEMMQATNWQQNSVRGFLAGTVKGSSVFRSHPSSPMTGSAATASRSDAAADMAKPSIDLAGTPARLSAKSRRNARHPTTRKRPGETRRPFSPHNPAFGVSGWNRCTHRSAKARNSRDYFGWYGN